MKLLVSEVAFHERRTQWREAYNNKLTKILAALGAIVQTTLMPQDVKTKVQSAIDALPPASSADDLSIKVFTAAFDEHKIALIPLSLPQTKSAFDRYFDGKPPFKKIKHRDDLPDGFVLAAAEEILKDTPKLHCVCSDSELRTALASMNGTITFASVDELMKDASIIAAREGLEAEKRWQKLKLELTAEMLEHAASEFVAKRQDALIAYKTVRSKEIPDDNHEALITMYNDPENLSFGDYEDFGSGWLSVPIEFETGVLIDFLVYRSDAFDVPEWVSVSYGDPEEEHYFEAQGNIRIRVSLTLAVHVDLSQETLNHDAPFNSVEMQGEPRIELLEVD